MIDFKNGGFGVNLESIKNFIKNNVVCIISVLFGIASLTGAFCYIHFNRCEECAEYGNDLSDTLLLDEIGDKEKYIQVDIKGAVKKKGVYRLLEGSTVNDAIEMAGGLSSNGTTSNINLSKKVYDEMVIYVFTKSELKEKESSKAIVCEVPKCECETVVVDREICTNDDSSANNSGDLISINTASIEELMTLDGIGESKAKAIIEYRKTIGLFSKIEDLMNVSGIGEKAFEAIKNKITV